MFDNFLHYRSRGEWMAIQNQVDYVMFVPLYFSFTPFNPFFFINLFCSSLPFAATGERVMIYLQIPSDWYMPMRRVEYNCPLSINV